MANRVVRQGPRNSMSTKALGTKLWTVMVCCELGVLLGAGVVSAQTTIPVSGGSGSLTYTVTSSVTSSCPVSTPQGPYQNITTTSFSNFSYDGITESGSLDYISVPSSNPGYCPNSGWEGPIPLPLSPQANGHTYYILFDPPSAPNFTQAGTASMDALNLSVSTNPVTWGNSLQITANETFPNLSGTVTFLDGSSSIGTGSMSSSVATFSTSSLAVGSHTLSATYTSMAGTVTSAPLNLTVNKANPVITWSNPAAITYGTALSGAQLNASANVGGTFSYSPGSGTVLGAGSQALSVTFTPTDTTHYNTVSSSVSLTVYKATPAISWGTPSAITYGTALSGTQLNATASVGGSFSYSPGSGTVLTGGSHTLSVTFTPSDTTDYNSTSASVSITVNKATPSISWGGPSAITYGTALTGTQLNATASVGGSYSYSPGSGTVLTAGTHTLSVTFSPSDSTDYNPASASVSITVNHAAPSISWSTPAAITYGTALSGTQLDATANVPGSFSYSPGSGTVLTAGVQTLSVTFTPTDTADYISTSASVSLTVNKASPSMSLACSPASVVYVPSGSDNLTTCTATVGAPGSTANVAFTYNGTNWTTQALSNSSASASGFSPGTAAQSFTIGANYAGDGNFAPASATTTFTVTKASQTISFSAPSSPVTYGTSPIALSASASSGLGVTFSVVSGPGTVSGNTLTVVGTGTIVVAANQTGNGNYSAASQVTQSVVVNASTQTSSGTSNPALGTVSYQEVVTKYTCGPTNANITQYTFTNFSYSGPNGMSQSWGTGSSNSATYLLVDSAPQCPTSGWESPNPLPLTGSSFVVYVNEQAGSPPTISTSIDTVMITPPFGGTSTYGQPISITAQQMQSGATGSMAFYDGQTALGTVSLVNGSATYTTSSLNAGSHSIYAVYTSNNGYPGEQSASISETVTKASLTVTANNASRLYGAANPAFTASYSGFVNGDTQSVLNGGLPNITTTASQASPVGTYPITPTVGTLNARNYTFDFVAGTLTINKATPTVTTWPIGSNISYPQTLASSTLSGGVASVGGSFAWTSPSTKPNVGTSSQPVVFTASDSTDYNTVTGSASVTSVKGTVAVSVSPSANTVSYPTMVILTATVSSGGSTVYPGFVTFCNASAAHCTGSALLGTVALNASGAATLRYTPLPGTWSVLAKFAGTSSYLAGASGTVSVTVSGTQTPTSVTVASTGSSNPYTLTGTVCAPVPFSPTGQFSFVESSNGNYTVASTSLGAVSSPTWNFRALTPFSVGGSSPDILDAVLADLNGDGIPDLIAVDDRNNLLSVSLGKSDGTFGAQTTYATGNEPYQVRTGDFNGDGRPDIVVVNEDNTVETFLGNGDGTLTLKASWNWGTPAGDTVGLVELGDVNGDGILDIFGLNQALPQSIWFGNGDGTFTFHGDSDPTNGRDSVNNITSFALADFNGDGNLDAALPDQVSQTVSEQIGQGNGSFSAGGFSGTYTEVSATLAGDFDGDGIPDVLVTDVNRQTFGVFLSSKGFATPTMGVTAVEPRGVAVADFRSSGVLDVLFSGSNGSAEISPGDGTGGFQSWIRGWGPTSYAPPLVADLNGDGHPDFVVIGGSPAQIYVFLNQVTYCASGSASNVFLAPPGTQQVTGQYSGDSHFASASASNTLSLAGGQVSTTVSLSAPSSVTYGNNVTLTATASPSSYGSMSATGTVSFYYGGSTLLGTASLSGGTASFSTAALPTGSQTVSAVYSGDTDFAGATSRSKAIQVNKLPTTVYSWPTASAITYWKTLSASTLTGGSASVPGIFAWYVPSIVPAPGANQFMVQFTPNDSSYSTVVQTIPITVTALNATATFVSANPTSFTYGANDTLSGAIWTRGAVPNGSVDFRVGSTDLGTASITTVSTVNDMPLSENLHPSVWFVGAGSSSLSAAGGGPDPFGGTSASILNVTESGTVSVFSYDFYTNDVQFEDGTFSVLMRTSAGSANITLTLMDNGTGMEYQNTCAVRTVWSRCSITSDSNYSGQDSTFEIDAAGAGTATSLYVADLQFEPGDTPGPYVATGQYGGEHVGYGATATLTTTALLAGTDSVTAAYENDTVLAASTSAPVTVTVAQVIPTIHWPQPPSVPSGTTLSSLQLDAVADIPGTFTYNPASGTVLSAGTQTLSTTFTPSDNVNYKTVTASTTVKVLSGTKSDSGTVTLSIDTGSSYVEAASTTYGAGATPTTIAAGLAAGVLPGSPVNVTELDDQIVIQSKTTGLSTDFPYIIQTTTYDSADFSQASFAYPSITGNLDGGADPDYSGGTLYSYSLNYDLDGNVIGNTDKLTGSWTYNYDTLNRLASASTTQSGNPNPYYCWNYDGFGNRLQQNMSSAAFQSGSGGPSPCTPQSSATQSPDSASYYTNNQIAQTNARGVTAYPNYDASGDVTTDGVNSYLYDAEGRICAVSSTPVSGMTTLTGYIYNAEGVRVSKGSITSWSCDPTVNGYKTIQDYVIGAGGEAVSEVGVDANGTMTPQRTYVYAAGALIATYDPNGLHFRATDWLGTFRAGTDYEGVLETTSTMLPFGDQLSGSSSDPHHFTGKERDSESGNDYFGARYYASTMGRFMSPDYSEDPSPVPFAELPDPQTLNLYSYGKNNPLRFIDPDGHMHQECTKSQSITQDTDGTIHVTLREHCSNVPDFWNLAYWKPDPATNAEIQAWKVASSQPGYWNHVPVQMGIMPWGMTGGLAGEIQWSSKALAAIAKSLEDGATSVRVTTKAEAEELFLRLYQGHGYRNTTGMGATEAKQMFGEKAGTYHWDTAGEGHGPSNPHGASDHLQIHTFGGSIVRIFFNSK